MKLSPFASAQKGQEDPTKALKGSLSARSELHHYRLNRHFPKRIREVVIEMHPETHTASVVVHFTNGHTLKRKESEVMSQEFLALCAMIYDLPAKG